MTVEQFFQVKLGSKAVVGVEGRQGKWFGDFVFPNISVSQAALNCDCASMNEAYKKRRAGKK